MDIVLHVAHNTSLPATPFPFSFRKKTTEFLVTITKLFTAPLSLHNKQCMLKDFCSFATDAILSMTS